MIPNTILIHPNNVLIFKNVVRSIVAIYKKDITTQHTNSGSSEQLQRNFDSLKNLVVVATSMQNHVFIIQEYLQTTKRRNIGKVIVDNIGMD